MCFCVTNSALIVGNTGAAGCPVIGRTTRVFRFGILGNSVVGLIGASSTSCLRRFLRRRPIILGRGALVGESSIICTNSRGLRLCIRIGPAACGIFGASCGSSNMRISGICCSGVIGIGVCQKTDEVFNHSFHGRSFSKRIPRRFLGRTVLDSVMLGGISASKLRCEIILTVPSDDVDCRIRVVVSLRNGVGVGGD